MNPMPKKPNLNKRDLLKIVDMYNQRYDIENEITRTDYCIQQKSNQYIQDIIKKLSIEGYPVTINRNNVDINLENGFCYYI